MARRSTILGGLTASLLSLGCGSGMGADGRDAAGDASSASAGTSGGSETAGDASETGSGDDSSGDSDDSSDTNDTGDGPAGVQRIELAGHSRADFPTFGHVQNFNDDASIEIAVDPGRVPAIDGATCDVFVVASRTNADWEQDGALVDVRPAGPESVTFAATLADNRIEVAAAGDLSSDAGNGLGVPYDVVLDCNRNAVLDGSPRWRR